MKAKLLLCLALALSGNCYSAIVYPKAPGGGKKIVVNHLDGQSLKLFGVSSMENLTIADPYRDYHVGLSDLASGGLLSTARPGDWTYLILRGTNAVGAAYLIGDEKTGEALKFNSVNRPYFPNAPLVALQMAKQLPRVNKQDYEVRSLDIAPILFTAIWLHGKSDDIIIPLPNTFGRWKAYQPYSENEMIKLLKPEAKKKLKEPPGMLD